MAKKVANKSRLGILEKLIILLIVFVIFLAAGFFKVSGRTPLQHLDRFAKTKVFQGSHNSLVNYVLDFDLPDMPDVEMPDVDMPDIDLPDVEMPDIKIPDFGNKKAKPSGTTGRKPVISGEKKVKRLEKLEEPMETITEEEEDALEGIIEQKGLK